MHPLSQVEAYSFQACSIFCWYTVICQSLNLQYTVFSLIPVAWLGEHAGELEACRYTCRKPKAGATVMEWMRGSKIIGAWPNFMCIANVPPVYSHTIMVTICYRPLNVDPHMRRKLPIFQIPEASIPSWVGLKKISYLGCDGWHCQVRWAIPMGVKHSLSWSSCSALFVRNYTIQPRCYL